MFPERVTELPAADAQIREKKLNPSISFLEKTLTMFKEVLQVVLIDTLQVESKDLSTPKEMLN